MKSLENSITLWRPWHLKQLELLQGTDFTKCYCQRFAQGYVVGVVQSGVGVLQYRSTSYEVTNGDLYVIEPREVWGCRSRGLTFQHLIVDSAFMHHVATEIVGCETPLPHFPRQSFLNASLRAALLDLSMRGAAPASRLQQQEQLLTVFAQLIHSHAEDRGAPCRLEKQRPAIKRIKDYLEEHYAEDVSLEDLVSIANLSAFHLTRAFRQTVGLPPHAYQIQMRMAHARTLLAQGFPVSYVASETGFFDQMHFTHQFKRHIGVTPGTYRKTARFY